MTEPKRPDVCIELDLITPGKAKSMLELNTHNRKSKSAAVARYARDMRNGVFMFTGESIVLDDDGVILDGQNRLMAVVDSDIPQWFVVVYGVSQIAQLDMDCGVARQFSDHLALLGVSSCNNVAALTRVVNAYKQGAGHSSSSSAPVTTSNANATMSELARFYDDHALHLNRAAQEGRRVWSKLRGASATTYSLCSYLFHEIDPELNALFWHHLAGDESVPPAPIKLLRESVRRWVTERDKPTGTVQLAIIFKTWNAWITGAEIKRLRFSPAIDTMPKPVAVAN